MDLEDSIISVVPQSESKVPIANLEIQNVNLNKFGPPKEELKPWSELLTKEERKDLLDAGHSIDAKKVTETLGFLDMKQICYCLAHALMKHIDFGKGFYFLTDLQQYARLVNDEYAKQAPPEEMNDLPIKNEELDFTYNLGDMKMPLPERHRQILDRNEQENEKQFLEIKQRLISKETPVQHKSEVEKIIKDLDEEVAEEEKLIEDCYDGLNDKKSSEEEDADLDYS